MSAHRPYVISIAGFDPSAGAGVLSDLKCFEAHRVYGFGVCSALTVQTDSDFLKNDWLTATQIIGQIDPLLKKFPVPVAKIGLIRDLDTLEEVCIHLKQLNPQIKIVVDPILKASAGYKFHEWNQYPEKLKNVLKQLYLITPNFQEMKSLGEGREVHSLCKEWSEQLAVLLKGGHNPDAPGTDFLYTGKQCLELKPEQTEVFQKHGSGCVLSAAITARLALGNPLAEACLLAKQYTYFFLHSNTSLLGYHSS
ncbi:hydroxymethylpyrimidine/phosphomethylpyrimidine kinase [Pedobacter sp. KBW06]|uniref:hydroxymethylpyrimidine/phosphomethylpyrimidine kinase n=1 Tax=Pedobacter sp. KBW06 TaxID=2153359 RepID=UPI000F597B70|nr:hydroxymethylpyrimidine/phosphomethylpyrimidine kinase [Pedobacter sp. KBW06]RQO74095.1 hydroxymethylpyrimidine/phosphomethylpyrimidine kinase [Pedobacter sp. KBW06]